MTDSPPTQPLKADRDLAAQFGIQANVVKTLREEKLAEGVHWKKKTGKGSIEYTADGVAAVSAFIELPPPEPIEQDDIPRSAFVPLPILRLCRNPLFVTVRTPDNKAADVRVRNNKRLSPRTLLQCAQTNSKWVCVHQGFKPL